MRWTEYVKLWERRDFNTESWWENLPEGGDLVDLKRRNDRVLERSSLISQSDSCMYLQGTLVCHK